MLPISAQDKLAPARRRVWYTNPTTSPTTTTSSSSEYRRQALRQTLRQTKPSSSPSAKKPCEPGFIFSQPLNNRVCEEVFCLFPFFSSFPLFPVERYFPREWLGPLCVTPSLAEAARHSLVLFFWVASWGWRGPGGHFTFHTHVLRF